MARLILIGLVIAASLIAVIQYGGSNLEERSDAQNRILDEGTDHLKKKAPKPRHARWQPAAGQPRTEAHEILVLALDPDLPAAKNGGATVLSIRGNRIVYDRPNPTAPQWTREVINGELLDQFLSEARNAPETPGEGLHLMVWMAPDKVRTCRVAPGLLKQFKDRLGVKAKNRRIRKIELHFESVIPADGEELAEAWPKGFKKPTKDDKEHRCKLGFSSKKTVEKTLDACVVGRIYPSPSGPFRLTRLVSYPR